MPAQSLEDDPTRAAPAHQPIRVALCGEVNAGKSTLLNALLRSSLLPDNIGCENRPLITARHRTRPCVEVLFPGGHRKELDHSAEPKDLAGAERIVLWTDAPQVEGYEFIELPITTADEVSVDDIAMMRSADVMIWVTIASQAWRLTEKSILGRFGKALPTYCMIVVSRADKLRASTDRDKLQRRIQRETAGLFDTCQMLFGARSTIAGAATSDKDWVRSGAPDILALLDGYADEIHASGSFRDTPPPKVSPERKLIDLAAFRDSDAAKPGNSRSPVEEVTAETAPADEAPEPSDTAAAPDLPPEELPALEIEEAPTLDATPPLPHTENELVLALREIALRFPPDAMAGFVDDELPDYCEVLIGEEMRCLEIGLTCRDAVDRMSAAYRAQGLDSEPEAVTIAARGMHLSYEYLPGLGLIFVLADASQLSAGLAKSLMTQMRRTALPAA